MKRALMIVSVATGLTVLWSGSAFACKAVPAKDWTGSIDVVFPTGASFAAAYFQQNACSWGSAAGLNGFDGLIVDVTGYSGTKTTGTITMGTAPFAASGAGYYLSKTCSRIATGTWSHTADGQSFAISIPKGAVWLVVTPSSDTSVLTDQLQLSIHSNGRRCR